MGQGSCTAALFEQAQKAFDSADYGTAIKYAQQVESTIGSEVSIADHGSVPEPNYSIAVVTFEGSPGCRETLERLSGYAEKAEFEILLVNNAGKMGPELVSGVLDRFRWIEVPFNYGCAGGRNIGARVARGHYLIFLDDDGLIREGAVERLIETITKFDAVSVRGRVLPMAASGITAPHYDLGDEITYSAPNAEGFSAWRRKEFLLHGGFDPLLSGWEGVALWSKMYRFYGADGFLYTPHAILFHDYAKDAEHLKFKEAKHSRNRSYLRLSYPNALGLKRSMEKIRKQDRMRVFLQRVPYLLNKNASKVDLPPSRLSIITTAKNASDRVADYTRGLKHQTHQEFDLLFVDCGSCDDTVAQITSLWQGDSRLRLIPGPDDKFAALNSAIAHASNDICVIADVGSISHPRRLELTLRYLMGTPAISCVSFATYGEDQVFGSGAIDAPLGIGMKTRSLLGMPVAFPTLAFRKSSFALPFDESSSAGFEYAWIFANLRRKETDGIVIPLNQVFWKVRDSHSPGALARLYAAHEDLLGSLSEQDKQCCRLLAGWDIPAQADFLFDVREYARQLILKNAQRPVYDQAQVEKLLLYRLNQLDSSFSLCELPNRGVRLRRSKNGSTPLRTLLRKFKRYF
jgi:glycosyltransferase involved in cell wall biosynthesis